MKRQILSIFALAAASAFAQDAAPDKAALQQRVGDIKQSIAQNQAQLKQYAWTETVQISLKGEEKKRTQADCKYGPDGKVQKTPIGAAPPAKKQKGLKGKIVANKIDEMKGYMDRVGSLVKRYLPPNPQTMQASYKAGKATIDKASGELVFHDYAKPGDTLTFTFDTATKKLRSIAVATYLDKPDEKVTVTARFSALADGTNFLEESVLDATAKEIQVKTTNSGHHKAGG
jgi:hypothetical protein